MEVCFLFLNSTTNNSKNGNNNNNNNNSSSVVARSVACGERNLDLPESVASTDPVHVGNWRVVEAAVPSNLGCVGTHSTHGIAATPCVVGTNIATDRDADPDLRKSAVGGDDRGRSRTRWFH